MATIDDFYIGLQNKVNRSFLNDYEDNRDVRRFGPDPYTKTGAKKILKEKVLSPRFLNRGEYSQYLDQYDLISPFLASLAKLFVELQDDASRELLIELLAYRLLGHRKVKLSTHNAFREETLGKLYQTWEHAEKLDTGYRDWVLGKFDLKPFGHDMKLFFSPEGIWVDFVLQQYRYHSPELEIGVQPNDVVIDAGGCWGDTALYFASRGAKQVFCYEFLPDNLDLLEKNFDLNPALREKVTVLDRPVWSEAGKEMYFTADGPGSRVSFENLGKGSQSAKTHTIDDLVKEQNLERVDFIKMDIEGAEGPALRGAQETIKQFSPDLAIAIYHSLNDFAHIHEYIHELNPDYKLYLAHHTIHLEETILFASVRV